MSGAELVYTSENLVLAEAMPPLTSLCSMLGPGAVVTQLTMSYLVLLLAPFSVVSPSSWMVSSTWDCHRGMVLPVIRSDSWLGDRRVTRRVS